MYSRNYINRLIIKIQIHIILERGDWLLAPGSLRASRLMDVRFELLPDYNREWKVDTRVRFHLGASEIIGRVVLLQGFSAIESLFGFFHLALSLFDSLASSFGWVFGFRLLLFTRFTLLRLTLLRLTLFLLLGLVCTARLPGNF